MLVQKKYKLISTAIIIFIALCSFSVHAKNPKLHKNDRTSDEVCQPRVNWKEKHQGPKHQTDSKWCAAYALSDMLGHYLDTPVSAVDIGVNYLVNSSDYKSTFAGIQPIETDSALAIIKEIGLCPTKFSDDNHISFESLSFNIAYVELIKERFDQLPVETTLKIRDMHLNRINYFKYFQKLEIDQILQIFKDSTIKTVFPELLSAVCESHKIHIDSISDPVKLTGYNYFTKIKMLDKINKVIDQDGIAYLAYTTEMITNQLDQYHASTVIGRRYNQENLECEYLIRNTWGEECDVAKDDDSQSAYQYKSTIECDRGNFWMNEDKLFEHIYKIIYIP